MLGVILFIVVVVGFGVLVMYNKKILSVLGSSRNKTESIFYRMVGHRLKRLNIKVERSSSLKKDTVLARINRYFKEIITNLDMSKDDVTPVGLITFISSISFCASVLFIAWSGEMMLFLPAFASVFYLLVIVFRFVSLSKYEQREAELMDTEDLIAMDVKDGVYNAIVRYKDSFHPNMKPYFEEFLDNIKNKGYGFREAMLLLNDRLGDNFTDFAQKAILYEERADRGMDDIFTSIIEINRNKRMLRYENNQKFNQLRLEFLISVGVIAFYCVVSTLSDPFLANFFKNTLAGKLVIIIDLVAVTSVLSYITSIKTRFI